MHEVRADTYINKAGFNKDAARLGPSPAGAVTQPESAAAAAAVPVPSPAGRVYVNDDLTRERSRVAARARQVKRDKKIKDSWYVMARFM